MPEFHKYQERGAYHWRRADSSWGNEHFHPALRARYMAVCELVPDGAQDILEVGCGDGYLVHLVGSRGHRNVYGIDTEDLAVKLANERLRRCNYPGICHVRRGSAYEVPFGDGSFDVIIMADVIEHLVKPRLALAEARRSLRQGGVLLLSTPNALPGKEMADEHAQEYTAQHLRELLGKFFRKTDIHACWPVTWKERWIRWKRFRLFRRVIHLSCLLGANPFGVRSRIPSERFAQLIARCKRL